MNDEGRPEPPFARLLVDWSLRHRLRRRPERSCRLCPRGRLAPLAVAAAPAAASPAPLAVAARPFLRPLAWRRVLRPLDPLLRRDGAAVLLDVDLHLVIGLERADRLAALADHHADLLLVDLDRGNARRVDVQLRAHLGDRLEHLVEDRRAGLLRLRERLLHDLARDARDLDVI